jgi:hypothetical protein
MPTYRIAYDPSAWVRIAGGAPEWRQIVTAKIDDRTHLVVVVVRGVAGPPRVIEAHIEQAYITRREGWKRRTVRQLGLGEVAIERAG